MNSYRLTSMEEPTDEMLAQIMREAADIYRKENEEAQKRVEARLRSLTQEYEKEYELEYGMKSDGPSNIQPDCIPTPARIN